MLSITSYPTPAPRIWGFTERSRFWVPPLAARAARLTSRILNNLFEWAPASLNIGTLESPSPPDSKMFFLVLSMFIGFGFKKAFNFIWNLFVTDHRRERGPCCMRPWGLAGPSASLLPTFNKAQQSMTLARSRSNYWEKNQRKNCEKVWKSVQIQSVK